MRILKLPVLALIAALILPGPVYPGSGRQVAVVTRVERTVEVSRGETGEWARVRVGDFLYEGDLLKTGGRAGAELSFVTGIDVSVGADTSMEIKYSEIEQRAVETALELMMGELVSRSRGRADLEVRTPQAVAAVRGTEFGVEVTGLTRVYVLSGAVDVFNDFGLIGLSAGQETSVESGKPPSDASSLTDEEMEKGKTGEKPALMLTIKESAVSGRASEYELSAVDRDGVQAAVSGRVDISASTEAEFSADGVRWGRMPGRVRLADGKAAFFLRPAVPGRMVISCRSDDFSPAVIEQTVEAPRNKELIIDVRDGNEDYRIKIEFERDD